MVSLEDQKIKGYRVKDEVTKVSLTFFLFSQIVPGDPFK